MKLINGISLLLLLLIPMYGKGQQGVVRVATETIHLQLNPIVSSALETSSDTWNTFVFDEAKLYQQGIEKVNASALSVKSNQNWVVTVRAEESYFREQNKGGKLPASILSVRANNGEYVSLSAQPIVISQSSDQSINERIKKIDLSYKAQPDKPLDTGNYTLKLIFTVTSR
jgi:hypothetical protein